MDVDGAEAPCKGIEGGPSCSRSIGKPASYFLEKADECFASFPPNSVLAVKFLEKGVSVHPNNVELLQRLAGEYAEAGKIEEAKGMLKKALELEGRGKKKKKSKAQNGIEGELVDTPGIKETRSRLASAYCAVAELYMTDLCDEEDAETNLEKAIERALELQPDSTEALLCDSQLKKIRDDSEAAVTAARRLYGAIKQAQDKLQSASLLLTETEEADSDNEEEEVSLETRVNACRLFIDVGMAQEAIEVLQSCLEEDEEDVWFVLCCALYKSNDFESALHCLGELRERLQRCGLPEDHPMAQHAKQLRELVEKELGTQRPESGAEGSACDCTSSDDEAMDLA